MLSILGRIGLLLRHPGFYVDQLDIIYTGSDRSFIASSGFFCLPCTMRKMTKICVNIESSFIDNTF